MGLGAERDSFQHTRRELSPNDRVCSQTVDATKIADKLWSLQVKTRNSEEIGMFRKENAAPLVIA